LPDDTSNKIFASQISLMELALKKSLNKLPDFVPDIRMATDQLTTNGFELLRLTDEHIVSYQYLPLFQEHKDPLTNF
jgi:PIN domain nuclease of toxin-antitoxin system